MRYFKIPPCRIFHWNVRSIRVKWRVSVGSWVKNWGMTTVVTDSKNIFNLSRSASSRWFPLKKSIKSRWAILSNSTCKIVETNEPSISTMMVWLYSYNKVKSEKSVMIIGVCVALLRQWRHKKEMNKGNNIV